MGDILTIRRYKRETFKWQGSEFSARIKRPLFSEQAALKEVMAGTFAAMGALGEMAAEDAAKASPGVQADLVAQVFRALKPELIERTFRACVSDVRDLAVADEDDAEPQAVTTGEGLLEVADETLVVAVLLAIYRAANLSVVEGKGSASPSTSSPEGVTPGGDSAATSTGAEAGPVS